MILRKKGILLTIRNNYVDFSNGDILLVGQNHATSMYVDGCDYPSVIRASADLCDDIEKVSGRRPLLQGQYTRETSILIGTIGHSEPIDKMISEGKLEVEAIIHKWESFTLQMVDSTLVIVGSDKRGTIYGIYDLSEKIGISPWHWWADVPVEKHSEIFITLPTKYIEEEPAVKYRGVFINDEYALHNWAVSHGDVVYTELYKHLFELLLRMKANYLWPAMHDYSPHFHQDAINVENAALYGIVIGSSHCEMMLRNNLREYFDFEKQWEENHPGTRLYKAKLSDSPYPCAYIYTNKDPKTGEHVDNQQLIDDYWRESVVNYGQHDNLFTVGMRGLHDAQWQPIGVDSLEERRNLLETIIERQRQILSEELNQEAKQIPQLFIPYKEMQTVYDSGLKLPSDITVMWTDDNYGYIRRLPDKKGKFGLYYHLSYHGYPNSYIWLCTTPLSLIKEELVKAFDHGIRDVWIANVGDIKPGEVQIEYFLNLARNLKTIRDKSIVEYLQEKAQRDFDMNHEDSLEQAEIMVKAQQLAFARKPEFFDVDNFNFEGYGMTKKELSQALAAKPRFELQPLFNQQDFWSEADNYVYRYTAVVHKTKELCQRIKPSHRTAYFEMFEYSLRSCWHTLRKHIYAIKSQKFAASELGEVANFFARLSDEMYYKVLEDTKRYNEISKGKWSEIMEPYQTYFRSCGANLPLLLDTGHDNGYSGIHVEAGAMHFSRYANDLQYITLMNTGYNPVHWKIQNDYAYLTINQDEGELLQTQRIWFEVEWEKVPEKKLDTTIKVFNLNTGTCVTEIPITIDNQQIVVKKATYIEQSGYISIRAEHPSRMDAFTQGTWIFEPELGRTGGSVRTSSKILDKNLDNTLTYLIYFNSVGTFDVQIDRIPTLNEVGQCRVALTVDNDEATKFFIGNNHYDETNAGKNSWGECVLRNNERLNASIKISTPGVHQIKLIGVDPDIIIEKIVIWTEKQQDSYFGPSESYNTTYLTSWKDEALDMVLYQNEE